jgi:DNA-binding NtrC family response regulator
MKGRILIVDDDVSASSTLEFHLHAADFATSSATSVEGALASVRDFAPDVILTESEIGELEAVDLIEALRGAEMDVDVVVITGRRTMADAIRTIHGGAYDYLCKPVDLAQLDSTLARCFRDRAARGRTEEPHPEPDPDTMVGETPAMIRIFKTVARVSRTHASVLIRGETGTGKELVARSIHDHSARASEPFVAVNCTALPETLLESELFGHVKGAFTGAVAGRRGRFETTGRGTLFLDEIGDTSPAFQAKLLRVLQDGEFHPVGSETPRRSEARIIAATHHDMEERVRSGDFRQDLYFRLRIVEIFVPPLRQRRPDIPRLARHFLARAAADTGKPARVIPPDVMRRLEEHDWPGNVRELENAITRAAVLSRGPVLHPEDLGLQLPDAPAMGEAGGYGALSVLTMDDAERRQVETVLERTEGNKRQAARTLKISRGRLDRLIRKHNLEVENFLPA